MAHLLANATVQSPQVTRVSSTINSTCQRAAFNVIYKDYSICGQVTTSKLMRAILVLIREHVCGVNPVETYIRSGTYTRKPSLPYTPGTDVSGVAGDFVFTTATKMGGYAEYTFMSEDCVQRLPASLDYKQGAAIGIPYFTAYRALFHKAHAKAGETTHPWSPRQ
ncbi:unnamed protein product, partial [Coregonus sp. 'balchen']